MFTAIIALLQSGQGWLLGIGLLPQLLFLQRNAALQGHSLDTKEKHFSVFHIISYRSWGLFASGQESGGLSHCQLLSQVIESSNVVHTALTHHTGKLGVHFCHIRKAT